MEYFWIQQDNRYLHIPMIQGFYQNMRRQDFMMDRAYKIPDRNVAFCDTEQEWDCIDIVDRQVFLVSEMVRQVFSMYEKRISYKFFCCLNNRTGAYINYYAPIIPQLDCLAEKRSIRLKKEKIGDSSIFRVKNAEKEMVVVRLDVAESLLRRNVKGIVWNRMVLA